MYHDTPRERREYALLMNERAGMRATSPGESSPPKRFCQHLGCFSEDVQVYADREYRTMRFRFCATHAADRPRLTLAEVAA